MSLFLGTMIDDTYHLEAPMAGDKTKARDAAGNRNLANESPAIDEAVAELLDHIAEELAQEYVRLMETAADK